MSAFTQGFNFGFASGMFNRMFGSFNMPCFNFFTPDFTPTFFTPMMNWGGFNQYSQPMPQVNMPIFNFNSGMNYTMPNFDGSLFNYTPSFDFSTPMYSSDFGDCFIRSNSSKTSSDKDTEPINYDAKALMNKWKTKQPQLTQEFYNKVVSIAQRVQCDPNDLMGIMNIESAGTFNPSKTNPSSGAVGLIQFMPKYVSSYGTTIEALKNMTAVEQLTYVEKYLIKNKETFGVSGKVDTGTLYALVFTPAYAKKETLAVKGESYYNSNPLLDKNKDGKITKNDLASLVREYSA